MTEPLKRIFPEVWVFDIETIPCIETARKVYGISEKETDGDVLDHMYEQAGATKENPKPMLKTIFQRVVAISAIVRKRIGEPTTLTLHSLPDDGDFNEKTMIERFLTQLGARRPQLVGFNTSGFDLTTLFQRAIVHGINVHDFCIRPEKPWDPQPDYFSDRSDWNVDLMRCVGGWGKATPSLVEIARACGIPAKVAAHGSEVADMWNAGKRDEIVQYCEQDVLSTYLLFLRLAHVSGVFGDQPSQDLFSDEVILQQLLMDSRITKPHLGEFLDEWDKTRVVEGAGVPGWYREKGEDAEVATA